MTDEVKGTEGEQEVQLSDAEQTASERGWKPKEAWEEAGNDPKLWKSAELYNLHGELIDRIGEQGKAIDRYKKQAEENSKAVTKLVEHTVKAVKMEREKVLRELKSRKATALREDDHEAVIEIDEEISQVKEQAKQDEQEAKEQAKEVKQESAVGNPLVTSWLADPDNKWYKENSELRAAADEAFDFRMYKGDTVEQALATASAKVKKEFAQHFKKPTSKGKTTEGSDDGTEGQSKTKSGVKGKYNIRSVDETTRKFAKEMSAMNPKAYPTAQSYIDAMAEEGYFNQE